MSSSQKRKGTVIPSQPDYPREEIFPDAPRKYSRREREDRDRRREGGEGGSRVRGGGAKVVGGGADLHSTRIRRGRAGRSGGDKVKHRKKGNIRQKFRGAGLLL